MEKVIEHINNKKTNIDIEGEIFICDDLCNIQYEYKPHDGLIVKNDGTNLFLNYNTDSLVKYNGGEEFGSADSKYTLKKIMIVYPIKHYIKSYRNSNGFELILLHESEDGSRFQNISVLLYPDDNEKAKSSLQYKLFKKFSNKLPSIKKGVSENINIRWNIEDMLPDEEKRDFYTYNSPFTNNINWVVYQNPVYVPYEFIDNYKKAFNMTTKQRTDLLNESPAPKNPPSLILFGRKVHPDYNDTKPKTEKCPTQVIVTKSEKNSNVKSADNRESGKTAVTDDDTKTEEDKDAKDATVEDESKKDDTKDGSEEDKSSEPWKWWQIVLIVLAGVVFIVIIVVIFTKMYYENMFNDILDGAKNVFSRISDVFTTTGNNLDGNGTGTGTETELRTISNIPDFSLTSNVINELPVGSAQELLNKGKFNKNTRNLLKNRANKNRLASAVGNIVTS